MRKVLTDKQLYRTKWNIGMAAFFLVCYLGSQLFVSAEEEDPWQIGDDKYYKTMDEQTFTKGKIYYFSANVEVCNSSILVTGIPLLSRPLLAVVYCITLIYLFLGIGIVSDIFMSAIEKVTSKNKIIKVLDAKGEIVQSKKVKVWNATVANLTLMALGSSAPEIILSILETCLNLGQCPGELGASTIVGSAAFNLLVISGVSIYAVHKDNDTDPDKAEEDRGVKKINNMYVFGVTATFSVWAYVWLFIVLQDQFVTPAEAWITFAFMFILLGLAYFADWYKAKYKDTKEDDTNEAVIEYTAVEIFKEMTNEQMGKPPKDEEETKKREKMKQFM
jgi:Ca2+/Na+ antiporter